MSEQVIADLVDFGLTSLQARVYVALLRSERTVVRQLVEQIGIIRPEAYRILRELSSKGLVQRVLSSPTAFTATPPSQALPLLMKSYREKLTSLEQKNARIIESLASLPSSAYYSFQSRFSVIAGWANTIEKAKRMITNAEFDYLQILSKHGLRRIRQDGIAAAMIFAKKHGVNVRVITEVDSSNVGCARFMAKHIEMRRTRNLGFYFDIADKKEMLMGPAITDDDKTSANLREMYLWTNNPRFIQGMCALFEQLWRGCRKEVTLS